MTAVPASLDDVTTSWLSDALAPVHGPVAAFTLERIGAEFGFASEIARVTPAYRPGAAGPPTVVVKLAGGTREAAFYAAIGDYAGVRVPHAYAAAADHDADRTALVLEDIGPARFGDDAVGLDPADTAAMVDALAALHARWWESPRLAEFEWLGELGATLRQRLAEFPDRLAVVLQRHGDLVPDGVRRLSMRIGPQTAGVLASLGGPPLTLLHVDAHADNVAFLDGEPVLFDWQNVAAGRGAFDLAQLLTSALRGGGRAGAPALLDRYHARLVAGGVTGYSPAQLAADHRVAALRLWVGVVGGLGSPAAAEWPDRLTALMRAALARWAAVLEETDAAALVG